MQAKRSLLAIALLSLPLAAQNASAETVTNGTFTGVLAPWVLGGGYSLNPMLDTTYATDGITVSDSFGCNPGGQVTPPPYPANTIEQNVTLTGGVTYEFRCDLSSSRAAASGTNADAGTIWVELGGTEIARIAFGSITITETKRAQLCARVTPAASGVALLRFSFQRAYLCNTGTPRVNLDNVSLQDVKGPTFCIKGNRKIGTTVPFSVDGTPGAAYASFLSAGVLSPGINLPGINGTWYLDFGTLTLLSSGTLDAAGNGTLNLPVPNLPSLKTTPLYYQAVTVTTTIDLSLHIGCVFTSA